jgi:hypothetical protein
LGGTFVNEDDYGEEGGQEPGIAWQVPLPAIAGYVTSFIFVRNIFLSLLCASLPNLQAIFSSSQSVRASLDCFRAVPKRAQPEMGARGQARRSEFRFLSCFHASQAIS